MLQENSWEIFTCATWSPDSCLQSQGQEVPKGERRCGAADAYFLREKMGVRASVGGGAHPSHLKGDLIQEHCPEAPYNLNRGLGLWVQKLKEWAEQWARGVARDQQLEARSLRALALNETHRRQEQWLCIHCSPGGTDARLWSFEVWLWKDQEQ